MKVKIHSELCIGCGLCEELVPAVFTIKGEAPEVKNESVPEIWVERVEFAIEDCPGKAIQRIRYENISIINEPDFSESLQ